jgi:hypothetical protein
VLARFARTKIKKIGGGVEGFSPKTRRKVRMK